MGVITSYCLGKLQMPQGHEEMHRFYRIDLMRKAVPAGDNRIMRRLIETLTLVLV